jgi:alkylation response protein AidB-like acyl-CoA dehydrogenase
MARSVSTASDPASEKREPARLLSLEDLHQRAGAHIASIAEGASEREQNRQLPVAQIRALATDGLLTWRIPRQYGGAGGSVRDIIRFIVALAAADSNIAQALRSGISFIEGLLVQGSGEERARWFDRYLAGQFVSNAGWEIGGANGAITARIERSGDHFVANGSKYYSTGALYADWISITALNEDGKPIGFVVPRDRAGLELVDDFDAVGQRLTASGTTNLRGLIVHPGELRARAIDSDQRSIVTPFLQLFLAAVEAGIARNALDDAIRFARDFARPIKHSSADTSVDDPYVQATVGEISARALAAESVVLHAADLIDAAWAEDLHAERVVEASVAVAQAQFIAIESAFKAAELLFDVGGGSATSRRHNLDRHWRNARTVANHNPRHWKAAVVGAYHLKDLEPPKSGLF